MTDNIFWAIFLIISAYDFVSEDWILLNLASKEFFNKLESYENFLGFLKILHSVCVCAA